MHIPKAEYWIALDDEMYQLPSFGHAQFVRDNPALFDLTAEELPEGESAVVDLACGKGGIQVIVSNKYACVRGFLERVKKNAALIEVLIGDTPEVMFVDTVVKPDGAYAARAKEYLLQGFLQFIQENINNTIKLSDRFPGSKPMLQRWKRSIKKLVPLSHEIEEASPMASVRSTSSVEHAIGLLLAAK